MITLQRPDPKVSALLGEKKGIKEGDLIKPSQFAVPLSIRGKQMVLNSFTRQCIETKYFEMFQPGRERATICFDPSDKEMDALVRFDFLVKEGVNEADRYENILGILRKMTKKRSGFSDYTILPTTACNARCVYCYEEGIAQKNMTDMVTEQTIRYIKHTRRKNGPVGLHWFGGEPMVGEAVIDRICEALREDKIAYKSSMISNGSLITAENAKKMKEEWNLKNVQITLDGREEVYCDRKRYKNFSGSPYRAVLNGIHELLKQNIRVRIRLNVEEENLQEMYALTNELEEEFENEKGISIYSHSIFAGEGYVGNRDDELFYDELDKLDERLWLFNKKRNGSGGQNTANTDSIEIKEEKGKDYKTKGRYYDKIGFLKRYYCMADNPSAGPVIMPSGEFCRCEHISEVPVVGTIFDETPIERVTDPAKSRLQDDTCRNCAFLPTCTDFTGCPTIARNCRREMLILESHHVEVLAETEKLPPILLSIDDKRILVKEPSREFAEQSTENIIPTYYTADEVAIHELK